MGKRFLDIAVAMVALVVASPVFLLLAVVIKAESSGPVFYRGLRVGRGGRPFRIYKFRSMVQDAEKLGASSTSGTDHRVTRSGRFVRACKLDEFAQLLNVLAGDMSLVGPRPEVQKFVDIYTEEEKAILSVRPGITDWSSIIFHNEGEIIAASGIADADEAYARIIRPTKLRLQLQYVRHRSFWTDLWIIACTIATIISTRVGGKPVGVPKCI